MVYLDNAATGGFKPRAVTDTAETVMKYLSANPGRSGHRLAIAGAEAVEACRGAIASFFNAESERVIFTKNCTESINVALFSTLKCGGHVITTTYEHNSVLRPLTELQNKGLISLDIVSPDVNGNFYNAVKEKITPSTYLVISTLVSNVTGSITDFSSIGALCKKRGLMFIADGAQGGGHVYVNIKEHNISMLALAGHKGLYGIMGSGALVIDSSVTPNPVICGGTGTESFNLSQPRTFPEVLESGTLNLPAICALKEGVNYVRNNFLNFQNVLIGQTAKIIDALSKIDGVKCYSSPNPAGIVALELLNMPSQEVADLLNTDFDIAVRGGFHCAPLMHQYLGTSACGLVRASVCAQNSSNEINAFIGAIKKLARR